MVKIELDIKGISWYIETTLETDTVPAVGDIIIVDKDCISKRDSATLWKTPSNQVFKWADEEDDALDAHSNKELEEVHCLLYERVDPVVGVCDYDHLL